MYSLADFNEYTTQKIVDKTLLVWNKQSGYHFLEYDEWEGVKMFTRIIGVGK